MKKITNALNHVRSKIHPNQPRRQSSYSIDHNNPVAEPELMRAIYDFEARESKDLNFKSGDILEIVNRGDGAWWNARHQQHPEFVGMIPSNFVVALNSEDDLLAQDWYFPATNRRDAVKLLYSLGDIQGTFLVRNGKDIGLYVLSIRTYDKSSVKSKEDCVNHYRIRRNQEGQFFIKKGIYFDSLSKLVSCYRVTDGGLCCQLTKSCPRQPEVVPFCKLEIDKSEITIGKEKLGSGNFGEVYSGLWKDKFPVAVKMLKEGSMSKKEFMEEAKILHRMKHKNLVQLMGVCSQSEPIYILTELMINGALVEYLRKDKGKRIKFSELVDMAAQIAEGMEYLEENDFIHRDLRAANILVGENNIVKVADFGLARLLVEDDIYLKHQTSKFPVKWTAPEIITYGQFSIKSDIWSFGILIYEIVTFGRVPYMGLSNREAMDKVIDGYRLPNPVCISFPFIVCPEKLYKLMNDCWKTEPVDRPTFKKLAKELDEMATEHDELYSAEDG